MQMEQKTYNWGIIGLGRIARKFADDLRRLPNARLFAVASTAQERADAFAAEYEVPHAVGSYEAMLQCPGLDVVYVATPHVGHIPNTLLCLHAGMPVLCEKPFAMHGAEARQAVSMAREKGVFLMEAMWSQFIPGVQKAIELAESGAIGRLHGIKAELAFNMPFDPDWRLYNKSLGGGALLDLGVYPAWLALRLFGKPAPEQVQAAANFTTTTVDASCSFIFQYPDNRLMSGYASVEAAMPPEAWLLGSEGYIRMHARWHHTQNLSIGRYEGRELKEETMALPHEGWGYQYEAAHVMQCLDAGLRESPEMPLQRTLDLADTLDVIAQKIGLVY